MAETNPPLPHFYSQTLTSLLPIFDDTLSLSSPSAQSLLSTSLDQLHLIGRMLSSLGVYSENETVDELGERELGFMTLGWVLGECEGKGGLEGRDERIAALKRSETAFNEFLRLVGMYGVLSPEEQAESSAAAGDGGTGPRDPAKRREAKIRQYKREKELRQQISTLARDRPSSSSTPLAFILSLFPSPPTRPSVASTSHPSTSTSTSVNASDDQPSDEQTRHLTLLILKLLYTLTLQALSSIAQELELLLSAPSPSASIRPLDDPREGERGEQDGTWRLDRAPPRQTGPRELVSGGGRVLRPFTILPSTMQMSDRERLRGEVFRSSHRLPTMTIDEYLDEERRRGNIIEGGGQASYDAPTDSELLALAAEDDGTLAGDEALEKKRLKDEKWTQYTDDNKRGAGNTMNRG